MHAHKHARAAPGGATSPWLRWSVHLLNSHLPVGPPQLSTLFLLSSKCCHPDSPSSWGPDTPTAYRVMVSMSPYLPWTWPSSQLTYPLACCIFSLGWLTCTLHIACSHRNSSVLHFPSLCILSNRRVDSTFAWFCVLVCDPTLAWKCLFVPNTVPDIW